MTPTLTHLAARCRLDDADARAAYLALCRRLGRAVVWGCCGGAWAPPLMTHVMQGEEIIFSVLTEPPCEGDGAGGPPCAAQPWRRDATVDGWLWLPGTPGGPWQRPPPNGVIQPCAPAP